MLILKSVKFLIFASFPDLLLLML